MRKTPKKADKNQDPANVAMRQQYESLVEAIRFLGDISAKIYGLLDTDEIYTTILDEFSRSDSFTCSILLLTDDKKHLRFRGASITSSALSAAEKIVGLQREKFIIDLSSAHTYSRVIEHGEIVTSNTGTIMQEILPEGLQKFAPIVTKFLGFDKLPSLLLPLCVQNSTIGIMGITPPALFDDFIPSAITFSRQISSALDLAHSNVERIKTEDSLQKSEAIFRSIFEKSATGYLQISSDGHLLRVNSAMATMLGYSVEEFISLDSEDISYPNDIAISNKNIQTLMAGEQDTSQFEKRYLHRNGTTVWCFVNITLVRDSQNVPQYFITSVTDISKLKQAELEVRRSEEIFSNFLEHSPIYIFFKDENIRSLRLSRNYEKMFGKPLSELLGKNMFDLFPSELTRNMIADDMRILEEGKQITTEEELNGRLFLTIKFPIAIDGKFKFLAGYTMDITERKQMEEELLKTQKLESLGVLAGGIAHDFNNLLGGIYGYIDLASEEARNTTISQYLSKAVGTIERARGLTMQLLTFAKGGAPIKKTGSLFPFVYETAQFALSGSSVSCNFTNPENIWPCEYDKNQIGQVIDNIVINAKQAMPEGGSIELTASNVVITGNEHPPLITGNYVALSIKDFGIGIPKNKIPRIFDPFYSTKATGHGLGLASCYSIIKRHNGCIDVESEPGVSSTFQVFLPASEEYTLGPSEQAPVIHRGSGIFIVMDDQEVMRDSIDKILTSFGYTVVCKENGQQVIDFIATDITVKDKIQGMIFDLTIPGGMGGKETIDVIRKLKLNTSIFVTSGYAEDPIMANPGSYGFTASICKPFRISELAELLNKYIEPEK